MGMLTSERAISRYGRIHTQVLGFELLEVLNALVRPSAFTSPGSMHISGFTRGYIVRGAVLVFCIVLPV